MNHTDALKKVHGAMDRLLWGENQAQWAGAFASVRGKITISTSGTANINRAGEIKISAELVASLPLKQLGYVIAHECSHPMLEYFQRLPKGGDANLFNKAQDVVINEALISDGGAHALPEWVMRKPEDYTGPMITEAIYAWFRRNPDKVPQGAKGADGQPLPGAGCGTEPEPKPGEGEGESAQGLASAPGADWGQIAQQARAVDRVVGKGSAVCSVIAPAPSFYNFAQLLRFGARQADTSAGRDHRTYARASRRDASDPKILLPGFVGGVPKLAIVIDASASMERDWIAKIATETIKLAREFSRLKIYLVTHTEKVCWSGWISAKSAPSAVVDATAFSGGTYIAPAYAHLKQIGRWDAILHFTDCEVERPWPVPPTKRFIVGAWGSGAWVPYSAPPVGAKVIPCRDLDLEMTT